MQSTMEAPKPVKYVSITLSFDATLQWLTKPVQAAQTHRQDSTLGNPAVVGVSGLAHVPTATRHGEET